MTLDTLARLFKAVSEPNRIRILRILEVRPLCVCEITEILGLAVSTVSRHLAVLREAGLIEDDRQGKFVEYRLVAGGAPAPPAQLIEWLDDVTPDDDRLREDARRAETVDRNLLCG